jgi:hypothetical protein
MPSASHSAVANASAAHIWARLSDLASWPHLLHLQYADESVTLESVPGVGAEFAMKGRLSYRLFARIGGWQPERRLEFEIHRSEYPSDRFTFARAVISIDLEPLDDARTRVTCEHTLWGRGPAGRAYAATVMRPFLKSNVQRIVDGLTAHD